LDIVAQLIKNSHGSVAIETPGYHLPRDVFRNNGFNINPIDVDSNGNKLNALKASPSTAVYITPSHQMQLGHVMPVANWLKLISWSKEVDSIIIEDDYDSELQDLGRPIASLQGLCSDGNIIYQGTFSKVFSPALRLSYMVLPKPLLSAYTQNFRNYLSPVPLLVQRAIITFMERG
jgi:GntR family transcriptional regulator/MocR family aminotransferase